MSNHVLIDLLHINTQTASKLIDCEVMVKLRVIR
jgi:hypothetical protein